MQSGRLRSKSFEWTYGIWEMVMKSNGGSKPGVEEDLLAFMEF